MFPNPFETFRAWFLAPLMTLLDNQMEMFMTAVEDFAAEIDADTNRLSDLLANLTDQLEAALSDDEQVKDAAIRETLSVLRPAVDRLNGLGADPANPVPDPTPEPAPVDEAPAAPADVPVDDEFSTEF